MRYGSQQTQLRDKRVPVIHLTNPCQRKREDPVRNRITQMERNRNLPDENQRNQRKRPRGDRILEEVVGTRPKNVPRALAKGLKQKVVNEEVADLGRKNRTNILYVGLLHTRTMVTRGNIDDDIEDLRNELSSDDRYSVGWFNSEVLIMLKGHIKILEADCERLAREVKELKTRMRNVGLMRSNIDPARNTSSFFSLFF